MECKDAVPEESLLLTCEDEDWDNDNESQVTCQTLKCGGQTSMEYEGVVPQYILLSSAEKNSGNEFEVHCHTLPDKADVHHDHPYAVLGDNIRPCRRYVLRKKSRTVELPVITESTVHDEVVEPVRRSRRLLVYPLVNRPDNRDYVGHQETVSTYRELSNVMTRCELCDLWLPYEAFKIKHMSEAHSAMDSEDTATNDSLLPSCEEGQCQTGIESSMEFTLAEKANVQHDHSYAALRDNYQSKHSSRIKSQTVDLSLTMESNVHNEVLQQFMTSNGKELLIDMPDDMDDIGHQVVVSTDRELNNVTRCEACDLWLLDEALRIKHMSQVHSATVYELKCGVCSHSFPIEIKEQVDWKEFLTDGMPLFCPQCKQRSVASLTLMTSTSLVAIDEQPLFWCSFPQCCSEKSMDYYSFHALVLHKVTEHGISSSKVSSTQKQILKAAKSDKKNQNKKSTRKYKQKRIKRFKCNVAGCLREYYHVNAYNYHLKIHKPGATNGCLCRGCLKDIDKHSKGQDMYSVNCSDCNHKHVMHVESRNRFLKSRIGFVCLQCNTLNRARPVMKTDSRCPFTANITYICSRNESCQAVYKTQRQLALHESRHISKGIKKKQRLIPDVYELKCGECGNIYYPEFKRNYVYLHEYVSEGVPISCLVCNKRSKASLTLCDSTPGGVDTQKCPMLYCSSEKCYADVSIVFSSFLGLCHHKSKAHTISFVPDKESGVFKCDVDDCIRKFYLKELFEKHMTCHELGAGTPCQCRGCLKVLDKDAKIVSCEFSCGGCGGKYTINMLKTSRYITSGIGFLCNLCNQRNTSRGLVVLDIAKPQTKGIIYMCSKSEDCQRKFVFQGDLTKHESGHNKTILMCDKCGMNVKKIYMQVHQLRYCQATASRATCVCQICKKVCNSKYSLMGHMRTVHKSIEKRRNFMCEKCGKQGIIDKARHVKRCQRMKKKHRTASKKL